MADDDERADARPQKPPASLADVVAAHNTRDMASLLEWEPCARDGLLYGVGAGTAAAFLGLFKRGSLISAGNWGFATFAVVGIAGKHLCHYQKAHRRARIRTLLGMKPAAQKKVAGFSEEPPADKPRAD
ncbi:hypothetical protein IWW55_007108 [Coemansia sp. RSA 2706]|nr:hypothetical protein LPJ63_002301 [Coemansia sp. RSA 2711]KAJ2285958.1 hypothetical protein IWW55_007108 [Coemansia sp. RSA 2706]KAJ2311283.1 hypothetical protein IWW51_006465 [Coemansia sp. RSA 2702]KAJ2311768.1 hypothetical protein IWW52_005044 [Coemansia sp. RSA 2704]KAJ2719053.1 hypothetical protein H4R23_004918 [Coemansia sp. Cherry 401B]